MLQFICFVLLFCFLCFFFCLDAAPCNERNAIFVLDIDDLVIAIIQNVYMPLANDKKRNSRTSILPACLHAMLLKTVKINNYKTTFQIRSCSYEDSLKSNNNHQIEIRTTTKPYHQSVENIADHRFHRRASFSHQPFDHRRFNFGRQSFSENIQKHFPPFERIGSGSRMTRQISTPNVSVLSTQPYFLGNKKAFRRKEALNEPMIDYDQSDGDDHFDVRINRLVIVFK